MLGLGFIFGLQFLIDAPAFGPPPLLPSNVFVVAIIISAFVIVCFYRGEYRRLERESLLDSRLHEDSSSSLLNPLTGYLNTPLSLFTRTATTGAASPNAVLSGSHNPSSIRVTNSSDAPTDFDLHSQDRDRLSSKIDAEFISASSSINLWAVSVHHSCY